MKSLEQAYIDYATDPRPGVCVPESLLSDLHRKYGDNFLSAMSLMGAEEKFGFRAPLEMLEIAPISPNPAQVLTPVHIK